MCRLGPRLLQQTNCTKAVGSDLWMLYCKQEFGAAPSMLDTCDPYFNQHDVVRVQGIQGLASNAFQSNIYPSFMVEVCQIYSCINTASNS